MSVTSKSPLDVLVTAWAVAKRAMTTFRHVNSPKKFNQHQLFACLVLKNFQRLDYRGITEQLLDCPSLTETIELDYVPHYTTLQKAASDCLPARPFSRCWTKPWRCRWGGVSGCRMRRSLRPGSKRLVLVPTSCDDETPGKPVEEARLSAISEAQPGERRPHALHSRVSRRQGAAA